MQWFTETAGPPMLIALTLGVICFLAWYPQRRGLLFVAGVACLLSTGAIFLVEKLIVTEAERIEEQVHTLAEALKDSRPQDVLRIFSDDQRMASQKRLIAGLLPRIDVTSLSITDLSAETNEAATTGQCRFRANGQFVIVDINFGSTVPTMWEMDWQREDGGVWRIVGIQRLHPRTEEPIDLQSSGR